MTDYFLRVKQRDRQTLLDLGVALVILQKGLDGKYRGLGPHGWDEIGEIREPTGGLNAKGFPVTAPICDEEGAPYWHANLRFVGPSLMDHCKSIYAWKKTPELLAAIQQFSKFFVFDPAIGEAVPPNSPERIFGGP